MKISVAAEPFDSADAQRLIAALDAHLASRYSADQRFGPNLRQQQIAPGLGTFVIARAEGRAVGCGALRRLDETSAAQVMGIHRLVLETGIYQAEAIGLYRRLGFKPVRCWGEYADVLTSVCFEKSI